ncbi:hypothetical protein BDQ17DRAFT_1327284 [Cyathus striatus]|nr:hypothetical protein BDQ17DRAFT_1327284 [Cyathus striatus]
MGITRVSELLQQGKVVKLAPKHVPVAREDQKLINSSTALSRGWVYATTTLDPSDSFDNAVMIGKVIVIYSRTGGTNGWHVDQIEITNIAANSYIGVQIFQYLQESLSTSHTDNTVSQQF